MIRNSRLTAVVLGLVCVAAVVCGCAGYRLGTSLPSDIRSVYVPTFVNRCGEPELEFAATSATIEEFQKDGTLRVEGANSADAILEVSLVKYGLKALRFSSDSTIEPSEYRLVVRADITLRKRSTGAVILVYSNVVGRSTFDMQDDLATAKADAFPDVAGDLAHDIVERVVEGW